MSFTQGLSGLNAASKQLEVIGNNVANANTVGFKGSQAQFGDVFAAALSGAGTAEIGIGVKLQAVAQQFSQGNVSSTNNTLDMAINGPGFFILNNAQGTSYSRNGQFQLDKNGNIVSSAGDKLQGYAIDPTTQQPMGSPQTLNVPTAVASAAATGASTGAGVKGIIAGLNLNSSSVPPTSAFNSADPTTYNNSTSTTTYDSKGVAQTTSMYFVKSRALDITAAVAPAQPTAPLVPAGSIATDSTVTPALTTVTLPNEVTGLEVGAVVKGGGFPAGTTITSLIPGASGTPGYYSGFTTSTVPTPSTSLTDQSLTIDVPNSWDVYTTVADPATGATLFPLPLPAAGSFVSNGTLLFSSNGRYSSFTPNAYAPLVDASGNPITGGPDPTTTSITFTPTGASAELIPFDFTASTQFGAAFGVTKLTQDGFTAGQLSGFNIGSDGIIMGRYSNGVSKPLGQVALATFPNMQGLQPLGSNEWSQSSASGSPVVNAPGTGNNGVLKTSATEDSNVDLTAELVNMITAQRTYQANAQTIKTQDSVMQTLINMR
jgi:flagellar hook protein FlgE